MTAADAPDDPEFEAALAEATDSLRQAYPDAAIPTEPSLDAIVGALADGDSERRTDAAKLLSMLAEQFPDELARVVPDVAAHLDGRAGRADLLRTLGYVSKAQPGAVREGTDAVVALLDDDADAVVRNAAWVLSNVATADPAVAADAFSDLVDLLAHDDEEVTRHAAGALAAAPDDRLAATPEVLDRLLDQLSSSSRYRTAGRALVSMAPAYGEAVADGLFECIETGGPALREHAAWALVPLADDHPDLVASRWGTLVELVRGDDDHQVQNSAAAALAAITVEDPTEGRLADLIGLLDHRDMFVRRYGCLALGDVAVATGDAAVLEALADARDDEMDLVAGEAEQHLVDAAAEHPDAVADVAPDLVGGDDGAA